MVKAYIWRLRKLLGDTGGDVLGARSPSYILPTGGSLTDLQVFEAKGRDGERAVTDGNPEDAASLLAEALALWRGSPLADVPRSAAIEAEQRRLEQGRLHAAELYATADIACGRYAETAQELHRLLSDHPLVERLWMLLMQALDGTGRRAEALEAYRQVQTILRNELGLDPCAELQAFHHQLLNGGTPLPLAGSVRQHPRWCTRWMAEPDNAQRNYPCPSVSALMISAAVITMIFSSTVARLPLALRVRISTRVARASTSGVVRCWSVFRSR
jgi:DNA-binding SARP family transcriptional activator